MNSWLWITASIPFWFGGVLIFLVGTAILANADFSPPVLNHRSANFFNSPLAYIYTGCILLAVAAISWVVAAGLIAPVR